MRLAIELFNAHLDGHQLTPEQSRTLSEWVKESPENARTLILLTQIHESLDSRMCVPRMLEDLTRIDDPEVRDEISDSLDAFFRKVEQTSPLHTVAPPPAKRSKLWLIGSGWAAAAAILLVAWLTSGGDRDREIAGPADAERRNGVRPAVLVATVDQVVDATWAGDEPRGPGGELLQGETLHLERGIVSLTTTVGHTVVVEGPAKVTVESPQQLVMKSGKAVGRVGVHGGSLEFTTPTATIRDLGTEFGVEVFDDRQTSVAVYEGAVELTGKASGQGEGVRLEAGYERYVSVEGRVLEEVILQHDRHFVRPDEVELRLASKLGDREAESLATFYALLRSGTLLAYQDFHASSRGSERTIGLGEPKIRTSGPLVIGADLNPASRLASAGLRLSGEEFVYLPLDKDESSLLAHDGLLNSRGNVGKDGTEIWIAWREQVDGQMSEPREFGGVSLTVDERDDSFDTYFGRVHEQGTLGAQFNRPGERLKHHLDVDPESDGVQQGDADGEIRRWVVQVRFGAASDEIRVWLDVPPSDVKARRPNFELSRDNVEFDRIRFAKTPITPPWLFDEVMMAASLDDLIAADKIINE